MEKTTRYHYKSSGIIDHSAELNELLAQFELVQFEESSDDDFDEIPIIWHISGNEKIDNLV